jgi:ABC-type antimicrobial peptide transport system permease subunit
MILLTGKLLVSGFLILVTFTITVVQPTRELHLLRCLGASRSHLPGSALAESAIVALLASLVGLGVLIANGLRAPLSGFLGADLPTTATQLQPRTVVLVVV